MKILTPDEFFYVLDEYCTYANVVGLELNQDVKHSKRLSELGNEIRESHRTLYTRYELALKVVESSRDVIVEYKSPYTAPVVWDSIENLDTALRNFDSHSEVK